MELVTVSLGQVPGVGQPQPAATSEAGGQFTRSTRLLFTILATIRIQVRFSKLELVQSEQRAGQRCRCDRTAPALPHRLC